MEKQIPISLIPKGMAPWRRNVAMILTLGLTTVYVLSPVAIGDVENPFVDLPKAEIIQKLNSSSSLDKANAALAVRKNRIKDEIAVDRLIGMLTDSSSLRWFPHGNTTTPAEQAARTLASCGDIAFEPLMAVIASERSRSHAIGWAAYALGSMWDQGLSKDPSMVEPLVALLSHGNAFVRARAAEALAQTGDPQAADAMLLTLGDEDPSMRRYAVEYQVEAADVRAIEPLLAMLADKLGQDSSRKLNDPTRFAHESAVKALGKIGDSNAVPCLIEILDSGTGSMPGYAAKALGEIGDARATMPLLSNMTVRSRGWYSAIDALGELGDNRAFEPLLSLLTNRNSRMQKSVVSALNELSGKNLGDVYAWRRWVSERDKRILEARKAEAEAYREQQAVWRAIVAVFIGLLVLVMLVIFLRLKKRREKPFLEELRARRARETLTRIAAKKDKLDDA